MNRFGAWLWGAMSRAAAAWMLQFYRRPMRFLLGLVAVPLMVIVGVAYRVHVGDARLRHLQHLHMTARLAAEIVDRTLQETLRAERLLLDQPAFQQAFARERVDGLTEQLDIILRHMPAARAALVVAPDGRVIAGVAVDSVPASVSGVPWFQEAIAAAPRASVSSVYLYDRHKVVAVVSPILRDRAVVGLLQVRYGVEDVRSWLQTIRVDHEGYLYVVDHHQQLVVHPLQILPGEPKRVSEWPTVAPVLPPDGASLRFIDPRTRRAWLGAMQPSVEFGWRVVAVQPESAALRPVNHVYVGLGMLLLGMIGLVALISWRWARLHNLTMEVLRKNAKLLRQLQQQRTLDRRKGSGGGSDG